MSNKNFELPWEVVDGITLANLQECLTRTEEELRSNKEDGTWMHPEDVVNSESHLIPSLKTIIKYFGG